jgi:TonB family protein
MERARRQEIEGCLDSYCAQPVLLGGAMIQAFLLAAATCTMGASVQAADAQLVIAEAAIARGDSASAKPPYDEALADLNATGADWFPKTCDEPRYALQRYVTTLHSLSVAVAGGFMPPREAAQHLRDLRDGIYRSLPHSVIYQYSELKNEQTYIFAIESAAQPQKVAAHEPTGSQCQPRDVDAEVLDAVPAYPTAASGTGNGNQPVVTVNVDADGRITSASIYRSTDDMALDQAALRAVRESTYLPAIKNCVRTAGSLQLTVTLEPKK